MSARPCRWIGSLGLAVLAATIAVQADDGKTVGRVRITTVGGDATAQWDSVSETLESRFTPAAEKRFSDKRLISLRPRADASGGFDATIYDYSGQHAYELVLDAFGNELSRRPSFEQPARSAAELADAYAIVRTDPAYARGLAKGELQIYEAMPPVTVDVLGRRLINVGITSPPTAGHALTRNEIVSVSIPTGEIVTYAGGAPETSRANLFACGPGSSGSCGNPAACATYHVSWPAADPVWQFDVRHPSCTSDVQGDGTGLELTNVYYRGRMILKRAEVPVLNVKYTGDSCGPYRDWLNSEDCFSATGTDAAPGMRVTTSAPSTLCESGTDAGNFKGVALYDQGNSLWLMTETNAGWYRYVMEWKLYLDGTIEPIFGFGATSNNCTCNQHFHHAYWRFEWAIDATVNGGVDDPATGINTLERHRVGTPDDYDPVTTEGSFIRPAVEPNLDSYRIRNTATGNGYIVKPGSKDGTANGDAYGKWDFTALALNSNQINDPSSADTSINIGGWVSGEPLGGSKRLVTWYHATWQHDDPAGTGEACEVVGPKLVPLVPCAGNLTLDRNAYACGGQVAVTLTDSDLANTGTATVAVFSGAEPVAETLTLTESPAGSGRFAGSILTTVAAAAVDGMISVTDGDAIHARYLDVSACGTPNVTVEKTAPADCSVPQVSGVTWNVAGTTVTINWSTSEAATRVVHYGTSIPTVSSASAAGTGTAHTIVLSGLAQCTTYYFWVESADAAGNVGASNLGGGYFAFTTGSVTLRNFTSTDTPIAIPDYPAPAVSSTINVPDAQAVQDVDVTINLTHTYDGDLSLSLLSPGNVTVPLSSRRGGSGDNFNGTIFNDEATTAISSGSAPFAGSYRPESPLSVLDGSAAAGAWKFRVLDQAGQDVGIINTWTLGLTLPPQTCVSSGAPPPVPEGSAGAPMYVGKLTSAGGPSIHLNWDTSVCGAKNYHLVYGQLASLPTYTVNGGICGLGPLGSYDWNSVPAGDLWFVAVSDDAQATEGSWGLAATGVDRNGMVASATCGFTARTNAGTCP